MRLISFGRHIFFEHACGFVSIAYRFIFKSYHGVIRVEQTFQNSRFTIHATGKIRRFWLVHFRKEYVQSQIHLRRGACQRCGMCCSLFFACPRLTKQGRCFVYDFCRPKACKAFPINQRDIDDVTLSGGHCGHYFQREDSNKGEGDG